MIEKLYKTKELASIFGVSQWTIREWFKEGKIPGAIKINDSWRLPESALKTYLETRHG